MMMRQEKTRKAAAVVNTSLHPSVPLRLFPFSWQNSVIYEQGVFRPLEPPDLPEQQRVTLVVSAVSPSLQEEDWLDVEVRSVFAGKVRTGLITEDAFRLLRRRFLADVATRQILVLVLMRND
jgi:predicted DNA-binding antitoxin AbrB/MazE fold protein